MKKLHTAPRLLCVALAAAFSATAHAEDDIERLTKPESTVTLGVGTINTGNQRFGMYNGMADAGTHLIGGASILRKNEETGTWLRFDASNLGLPSRELRIEHEKQGDWGYYLDYSEFQRVTPYAVHTNLQGIGSTFLDHGSRAGNLTANKNAQQPQSANKEIEIRTDRYKTTLGFMKFLNPQLEFAVKFQNEEKHGERLFGRGSGTVQEFLAEPIDSTTRQIDMTLSYIGNKLQLTGGYYGSFFQNHNNALNVTGGAGGIGPANNAAAAGSLYQYALIGLPPDNQAHQIYVTGGYDFTRTTRASFKYSYSRAEQTDTFALLPRCITPLPAAAAVPNQPTNDSCRDNLGGRVDTTLFQAGLSSRPTSNLSLLANVRYEDRNDNTDLAQYIRIDTTANNNSTDGYNERRSLKTLNGKFEASYQLPGGYRLTGGVDYEEKDRSMGGVRIVGYRAETEETSYRAEVKRALSDSITGTAAYIVSNRNGSDFKTLTYLRDSNGPVTYPLYANGGYLQPIYIADRDRQKFRLLTDWSPTDALSVQVAFEDSRDRYEDREKISKDIGARSGYSQLFSLDASYAINDNWRLNGYASTFVTQISQAATTSSATPTGAANYWTAAMKSIGTNFGFGVKGKISGKVDLGADVLWSEDRNVYKLGGAAGATAATTLPDINWVQTTFKLYGTYAYDKDTKFRLDYMHDRRKTNDWTWTNFTYTDGTWLGQEPLEKVHFIGASVQYSFR